MSMVLPPPPPDADELLLAGAPAGALLLLLELLLLPHAASRTQRTNDQAYADRLCANTHKNVVLL